MQDALIMEIPPSAEYVGAARLFVAASARHYGVDEESVADLKVAISEACTSAIQAQGADSAEPVRVALSPNSDSVGVEVAASAGFGEVARSEIGVDHPTDELQGMLGLLLIRSLFPEADLASQEGTSTLNISVPLPV